MLSRSDKLREVFADRFTHAFRTVGNYYAVHASAAQIDEVSPRLSQLAEELIAEPGADADDRLTLKRCD